MGKIKIVLVCHTEIHTEVSKIDNHWKGFELGLDTMTGLFERVGGKTGKMVKITYCLTPTIIDRYNQYFRVLQKGGHEIGVHSQWDGDYIRPTTINEQGYLNHYDSIPFMVEKMKKFGFSAPKTNASYCFALDSKLVQILEQHNFAVDCSMCCGQRYVDEETGITFCDNRERKLNEEGPSFTTRPYRIAKGNHCREGNSKIIEFPVSGALLCVSRDENGLENQINLLRKRWNYRGDQEVDVYQIFWHIQEALTFYRRFLDDYHEKVEIYSKYSEGVEEFLTEIAGWDDLEFATASEAADAWKNQGK